MAKKGRPDKLTPAREARIVAAIQQVGITQEEAAAFAGISEATFYRWKTRAAKVAKVLPAEWREALMPQLWEWADDLSIERDDIEGTGKGGRVLRKDLEAAIQEHAGRFLDFFDRLKSAQVEGEMATAAEYRAVALGGRWRTDENGERVWEPVERTKVRDEPILDDKGEVIGWRPVYRDRITGHDEKALRFILERRYPRWNPRKAIDVTAASGDPNQLADQIQQALAMMDDTVPTEPE